jgi:hypothetical protein
MSAGQQSNFVCGAAHFSQSASTLQSRDTGLTEFLQHMIKERLGNIFHATLSEVSSSRQDVSMCTLVEHQVI